MKLRFFTLLLSTILAAPGISFAQSNFVPGYVITSAGDTLQGYLDSRGDARNSTLVKFKPQLEAEATTYKPTTLLGYSAGGKQYVTKEISFKNQTSVTQELVFLEHLVNGKVNLYFYKDYSDALRFFAQKDTSGLLELLGGEEKITINNQDHMKKNTQYLGILNYLFQDCKEITLNNTKKYQCTIRDLSNLVTLYNTCVNPKKREPTAKNARIKTYITKTIFIGMNQSRVETKGAYNFLRNADTKWKPMVGASFNLFSPNFNKKTSLQLDALYSQKGANSTESLTEFDLKYLDLSLLVKYHYPKGMIRPFIGAGGMYGFILNRKHAFESKSRSAQLFLTDLNSNEVGFCVETGVTLPVAGKFITLGYRYEYAMITFNLVSQSYINRINQFRIGYTFR